MADVIADVEQITPDWLTNVLGANGHLVKGRVTGVELKASRQTIISNIHYLELRYSADASEESPSKLFLKLSKPGFDAEIAARFGERESQYYNVIAKSTNDPPSAKCYDAAFSPDNGKSHMLLADLSRNSHIPNRHLLTAESKRKKAHSKILLMVRLLRVKRRSSRANG